MSLGRIPPGVHALLLHHPLASRGVSSDKECRTWGPWPDMSWICTAARLPPVTYCARWLEAPLVACPVVLVLGSGPPALSAAEQAMPSAGASPCFAAAAGGRGPEPPYGRHSPLPSDPSAAAPDVETQGNERVIVCEEFSFDQYVIPGWIKVLPGKVVSSVLCLTVMLGKPFCIYISVLPVFCHAALTAPLLLCLCRPLVGEHHQRHHVAHKNDKMVPTQALRLHCILYNVRLRLDSQEQCMRKTASSCFYLHQFSWRDFSAPFLQSAEHTNSL